MAADPGRDLPPILDRYLALDERGTGLRATWRPAHGFVNLSLWREDSCVETFHRTPTEAAKLVSFMVEGLADAVPTPAVQLSLVLDVEVDVEE